MKKVKIKHFASSADHLYIEIGKEYEVKEPLIKHGKLEGYYIHTPRNLWVVSVNQVE